MCCWTCEGLCFESPCSFVCLVFLGRRVDAISMWSRAEKSNTREIHGGVVTPISITLTLTLTPIRNKWKTNLDRMLMFNIHSIKLCVTVTVVSE